MDRNQDNEIEMYGRMMIALEEIEQCREFAALIPEIRTNMAYARTDARTPTDVIAIDGRITVVSGMPRAAGRPRFGASDHMARLIIAIQSERPELRTAIDFANTPDLARWLEEYCRQGSWAFAIIDRRNEPETSRGPEGSTMQWKAQEALRAAGDRPPKIFCDAGAFGKEPVSVILGRDPVSTAGELCEIARLYAARPRH